MAIEVVFYIVLPIAAVTFLLILIIHKCMTRSTSAKKQPATHDAVPASDDIEVSRNSKGMIIPEPNRNDDTVAPAENSKGFVKQDLDEQPKGEGKDGSLIVGDKEQ